MFMVQKIEWEIFDYVASDVVKDLIDEKGYSNRKLSELLNNEITYGRIQAIKTYRRAPIRLREFIDICLVCGANPAEKLKEVMEETDRREAQQAAKASLEEKTMQTLAKIGKPEYGLAAHQSSHKLDPETYD